MRSVLRELAIGALISCLVVLIGCLVIGLAAGFYYYPIITSAVVAPLVIMATVYLAYCFTYVAEGTAKNVIRFGGYRKTLLAKKDHELDKDGFVVPLQPGESPGYPEFLGGLRWVSLLKPLGIDKVYIRTMRYTKFLPGGNLEARSDEGTDFILAGTQYQYGVEFKSAEDKEKLPLSGSMTLSAMIVNPYKALFLVRDWFDALIGRVLPRVREYISEHTYDEIIQDPRHLDTCVFNDLATPDPDGSPSIISILREQYGIELIALETVNIDPPEGYREATLAKWKARQTADKDVEETAGRILKSVAMSAQLSVEELKEKLAGNDRLRGIPNAEGGFKEDFEKAWDQVKRDRAGAGLRDVRVGNADGTNLDPVTAWVAGLIGLAKDSGQGGTSGGGGSGRSKRKKVADMTDEEIDQELGDE